MTRGSLSAIMLGAALLVGTAASAQGTPPDREGRFPALERQPFMRGETRMLVSEVLIHQIDPLRLLLGPLEVVACQMNRICTELPGEDTALIQMRGRDGLGVQIFATFAAHGHPSVAADRLEILRPAGAIRLDGGELSLTGAQEAGRSFDPAATYQASYDAAIAHFVDRLADGQPFETAPEDNLQTLFLVEGCYRLAGRMESR